MTTNNIEILGQKLSYPETWHGMIAVLLVCLTLFGITSITLGWATPEILQGLKGLTETSMVQQKVNEDLLVNIRLLSTRIQELEHQIISNKTSKTSAGGNKSNPTQVLINRENIVKQAQALATLNKSITLQNKMRTQLVLPYLPTLKNSDKVKIKSN